MTDHDSVPRPQRFEILLVEDNPADANIFETALRQASTRARAYWVATAAEAMDFLRQKGRFEGMPPVKIVILDAHLPGQDGFDILRQIKSDPDLNRKPVIMLTSSMLQDEIDLAYSLGANAYFRKPMTLESCVEQVRIIAQHWLDLAQLPDAGRSPRRSASTGGVVWREGEEGLA